MKSALELFNEKALNAKYTKKAQNYNGKHIFPMSTIGGIDKSFCPECNIKIIDFDQVTWRYQEVVSENLNIKTPSSCDCLKICPLHCKIYFIELKCLNDIFQKEEIKSLEKFENKIDKFGFYDKIVDSINTFYTLLSIQEMQIDKKNKRLLNSTPINYIILVDDDIKIDPILNYKFNMMFLSKYGSRNIKEVFMENVNNQFKNIAQMNISPKPYMKTPKEIEFLFND